VKVEFFIYKKKNYMTKKKTKEEKKEYDRKRYLEKKEEIKKRVKEYSDDNKEKIKEYQKEYYEEHKEKIKEYKNINKEKIKEYQKEQSKKYRQNNKEQLKEKKKEYNILNKEKIKEYHKEYRQNNKEKRNTKQKDRKEKDPIFKLSCNIRNVLYNFLKNKGYTKKSKSIDILGCSYEDFKLYLETKFESWMNWQNYGNPVDGLIEPNKTWDIDHIIPISSAINEDELLKLNHYTNLQPLCSYYNRFVKKNNF